MIARDVAVELRRILTAVFFLINSFKNFEVQIVIK